jgi:alpha-beta hydrolase superfamily lysophospholipase
LISAPTIVIENSADDAAPSSHAAQLFGAVASTDKEHHVIAGATHYYRNQPEQLAQAVATIAGWMGGRGYLDG